MKKLLVAFVILLAFTTGAYASSPTQQLIEAYLSPNITVKLDGQVQTFRDANGSVIYPIIYNGTTYLPLRSIGNLMGKEVSWDNSTNTVYLGLISNSNQLAPSFDHTLYMEYSQMLIDNMAFTEEILDNRQVIMDKSRSTQEVDEAIEKFMVAYRNLEDEWTKVTNIDTSNYDTLQKSIHTAVYEYINAAVVQAEAERLLIHDYIDGKSLISRASEATKYGNVAIEKANIAAKSIDLLKQRIERN